MEKNFESKYVFSRIEKCASELSSSTKEIAELFLSNIWREMMNRGETTKLMDLVRELITSHTNPTADIHGALSVLGVTDYTVRLPKRAELLCSPGTTESSRERNLTLTFVPGTKIIPSDCLIGWERHRVSHIVIPDTTEKIESDAFAWSNILDLVFPATIKEIPCSVCCGCKKLETVVLPVGITKIDDGAFRFCDSLKEIDIPSTVTSIGHLAFEDCDLLPEETRRKIIAIGGEEVFGENTKEDKKDDES